MSEQSSAADMLREIADQVARITAENRRLLQRLAENEKHFRVISRRVLQVQEAERGRIARELHDSVGQSLTAIKIELDLLQQSFGNGSAETTRLRELAGVTDRALQEVRELSHLLRPHMLDELGLVTTLKWLVRVFQTRHNTGVHLIASEIDGIADPDIQTLLFRIVQESLTNVAKHARARTVAVQLARAGDRISLHVHDDGVGFDARSMLASTTEDGGFGLRGMRDRVMAFGGTLEIASQPGAGTRIDVEVPVIVEQPVHQP